MNPFRFASLLSFVLFLVIYFFFVFVHLFSVTSDVEGKIEIEIWINSTTEDDVHH